MKEYTINVYNVNTLETIDTFVAEFENAGDLCDFMDTQLHNYDVKYVCRAGKKQGENVLSDLDKAKNYINFEIERIKKNE